MKCTEINRASAHRLSPGRLIASALKARERAVGPHSKFKVGAALLTRSGKIIGGTNVESASAGLTCCAERVALFKALTESERDFLAVASWPGRRVARCPVARASNCWQSMRQRRSFLSLTAGDPR